MAEPGASAREHAQKWNKAEWTGKKMVKNGMGIFARFFYSYSFFSSSYEIKGQFFPAPSCTSRTQIPPYLVKRSFLVPQERKTKNWRRKNEK